MRNQKRTILGISPGMHTMGMAVVKDTKLIEQRMKVFNEPWSKAKLKSIVRVIRQMVEKHEVTVIALKVMHPSRSSEALTKLIAAITALAKSQQVVLYTCTIMELKKQCSEEKKCNKGVVVEYVLQRHPELHREYQRQQIIKNPYYVKAFEAIALARLHGKNRR